MQKLIIVIGPTASGKSDLAVFLAREIKKHHLGGYNGAEIISADSRQVYKYLNVGTNKVPGSWQTFGAPTSDSNCRRLELRIFLYKNIPHHCIDFVHPKHTYTVAEFKTCAKKAIAEIQQRGNIPILVGGTGLYIQTVADGLVFPDVPPNKKLRALLEKKSTKQLFAILKKLDPARAHTIDSKNPRRLIRAIEIVKATGNKVPQLKTQSEFQTLRIGIKKNDAELKKAIEQRSQKQIPGLLREIRLLLKMKIPKKRIREFGFEYVHTLSSIEAKPLYRSLASIVAKENWQYAKRQMTWFKRDKRIQWIKTKK